MKILIAVASRHGSTREIADTIAGDLRSAGHVANVVDVGEIGSIEPYDAAVIGSAVYLGNWLSGARDFVARNQTRLATIPVWLFSSGPIGKENPQPASAPAHMDEMLRSIGAREHRIFVGLLDKRKLTLGERLITTVVRAPDGDFRDWDHIHEWAREIAAALLVSAVPETAGREVSVR